MFTATRCEADNYVGDVCGQTLRDGHCQYGYRTHLQEGDGWVRSIGAGPEAPYRVIGKAIVLEPYQAHEMSQYPGADRVLRIEPQTVLLTSNGYYCAFKVTGTVTGRGYYGGPLDVVETYVHRPYSYQVVEAIEQNNGRLMHTPVRFELTPTTVLNLT